ncbi:hypothetical protein TH53_19765 [Pedobacter lusitanus]|uniref:Uncharacterized protein n=1 Tax=Pedobacter lusitanus TaxID=1503925 RepID=A0A0D0F1S1_9SPHI|nr:hypothetical protein [Pedobacter lusitanus]KIO75578.1 hypothetical protein TH53_19765 [Pedobacter lusitanus]
MIQPIYLHRDPFPDIVAEVSRKLLPQLKAYDEAITGIHYHFGHPLEIVNTLGKYEVGTSSKFDKYPLVAFFLDTTVQRGKSPGIYGEFNVHMAIIRECLDPNQTADERDKTNFIPVLTPIYLELMHQISLRGDVFQLPGQEMIPHDVTNRYYWGKSGLWGNEGNIFNDWVDCIELNIKLKVFINYCPKQVV